MRAGSSFAIWGRRSSRLGLACLVASFLLALSPLGPADSSSVMLGWLGVSLIVLGFFGWRRALVGSEIVLPLRSQVLTFLRPLVGQLVLIAGVMLAGAALAADSVPVLQLVMAGAFLLVGGALAFSENHVISRRLDPPA